MSLLGESVALIAAFSWAFSTYLYKQFSHQLSAFELNVSKGVLASLLMLSVILVTQDMALPSQPQTWLWLIFSGVIGIAVGDSAYFAALKLLGPARTLVVESLAPMFVVLINYVFFSVNLSVQSYLAITLTTLGVVIALYPDDKHDVMPKSYLMGITFALTAAFCQALGMVLTKQAVSYGEYSTWWAALIRLLSGTVVIGMLIALLRHHSLLNALSLRGVSNKIWLVVAIFFGTFLGVWLQFIAVKFTDPAIAQTLFATSPLIVMTIAFCQGNRLTRSMVIGGLLAFSGVVLIFMPH
ncbi:DMT family transporter [Pseudoalteromonas xiamenensis]|uniref:DMT family transporter n=1 Tax=Pseudoalteromonas xiamenensis TaxID=882626 RepID=UPI0027E4D084|nr:DMT family transporter [Pseudoalteromonas xiamenensis]WMN59304.1 DMT family transporter [Pseudoalteromonas xiamenensis]